MTQERTFLNEVMLERFRNYLQDGQLLYDIGKPAYDYESIFSKQIYKTVDCNPAVNPDIVCDIEAIRCPNDFNAEAVICNGVAEQCENPFNVVRGIDWMMKDGAVALFGIISVGYPIYDTDYVRFTPNGALRLLQRHFRLLEHEIVRRDGIPSYIYAICRKE